MIGVPTETFPGERRVALTPDAIGRLRKAGLEVKVQAGAGERAGFLDRDYEREGASVVAERVESLDADIICQVRCLGANPEKGAEDLEHVRAGQVFLGHAEPLTAHEQTRQLAEKRATLLAVELIPRITRAQSMDALSSQANLAGYKAVVIAADTLGKMFPMMMTAAGTIKPAKVFVIGAGVAGLQAIATANRLGATVFATDVRPEVREQIESLGARAVMPEQTGAGEGGYAKEQTDQQKREQRKMMAETIADADVVITTAAVPGKKAPVLVSAEMVRSMRPGSVIVDLAAERGGNCELTEPDRITDQGGVTIVGTGNLPATIAHDASRMYANNLARLLEHLVHDGGELALDTRDEITAGALICRDGEIVNPKVKEAGNPAP